MKRESLFLVALLAICLLLCACHNLDLHSDHTEKPDDINEEMSECVTYSFASYELLHKALCNKDSAEHAILIQEQINCGKVYQDTLASFESGEIKIAVPCLGGNNMNLRDMDGYSNISLLSRELYDLPWIWYHCVTDEYSLDIKVAYPCVLDNSQINSAKSYRQVLRLIAPDAPLPENLDKYDAYSAIYEKEIKLGDGSIVTAMISEMEDSHKVYVMFYQNGKMIVLRADRALFNDAFWQAFSINCMP